MKQIIVILTTLVLLVIAPISSSSSAKGEHSSTPTDAAEVVTTEAVKVEAVESPTTAPTEAFTVEPTTDVATEEITEDTESSGSLEDTSNDAPEEEEYVSADYEYDYGDYEATDDYTYDYSTGYMSVSDYERDLLARVIYAEVGCYWIPDDVQLKVGSVVLNRLESDLYPDTIQEVLYDPGQYVPSSFYPDYVDEEQFARACRNADALLESGSILPADVLGQNGWGIGDGIHSTHEDEVLGTTVYFTYIW